MLLTREVASHERARWLAGAHPGDTMTREYLDGHGATWHFTSVGGVRVEVLPGALWWGDTRASAHQLTGAWRELAALVRAEGGELLSTPAATGRDLWLRTLREPVPACSSDVAALIRGTAGQGRVELFQPAPAKGRRPRVHVTELDARLAYAACLRRLPVGTPARHTDGPDAWRAAGLADHVPWAVALEAAEQGALTYTPARWHVTVHVPHAWGHVGLVGHRADGRTVYPAAPGTSFVTWVDGAELKLLHGYGWPVKVHDGLVWPAVGEPLRRWADVLLRLYQRAEGRRTGELLRAGVRAILLHTIGAFVGAPHRVTGTTTDPDTIPADAENIRHEGAGDGRWVWHQAVPARWPETVHPEWSAAVWARARVRLLDGPNFGALHVPAGRIVAMRTDAVYVAGSVDVTDNGKPGQYRIKRRTLEPVTWPRTTAELLTMRAEKMTEG